MPDGDPTDGFPGLPGFGPKKAEALFKSHRASWSTVEAAYINAGLTKEDALTQARLARILRWSDWDAKNNTYKLWELRICQSMKNMNHSIDTLLGLIERAWKKQRKCEGKKHSCNPCTLHRMERRAGGVHSAE